MKKPPITVAIEYGDSNIQKITLSLADSFGYKFTSAQRDAHLESQIITWLEAYLAKKKSPSIPLNIAHLTPFNRKVLEAVQAIPSGATFSYGEIAALVGSPRAARAVGNACRLNPFPLIIPCHRVVLAGGGLCGFAFGKVIKKYLLDFEKR